MAGIVVELQGFMYKVGLFIPTLNAKPFAGGLRCTVDTANLDRFLIIDSGSTDGEELLWSRFGATVVTIDGAQFDHGRVRKMACELLGDCDVVVFLTQDAIPLDRQDIRTLVSPFENPEVGAAFGRQLPRPGACPIEAHARCFNYFPESRLKSVVDIPALGLKATFISNSFAAYRHSALKSIGGFPERCIVSEDTYVAAKMLLAGWKIAYCAEAQVYHSHSYNWRQEFQRYFDIGVFHAREPWVRKEFGDAEGEGKRFVKSELNYLAKYAPHLIPSALLRTVIKYAGFRTGLAEKALPLSLKRRLSQQKAFWNQE